MSPVSRSRRKKPPRKPKLHPAHQDATMYPPQILPDDLDEPLEVLERRRFAMPYGGTRIGGEDYRHLDPSDANDRHILLVGEHPEYHVVFEDPLFDGEINGANPRLHITIDEVVVNQLWDNTPPEMWQAAQRLQAAGMQRLDIIHSIANIFVRHMFPALKHHEPFDETAYRADLRTLTAPE